MIKREIIHKQLPTRKWIKVRMKVNEKWIQMSPLRVHQVRKWNALPHTQTKDHPDHVKGLLLHPDV